MIGMRANQSALLKIGMHALSPHLSLEKEFSARFLQSY